MELISVGFLLGSLFSVIILGAGVIYGRNDKREPSDDSNHDICIHDGDGNRSCDNRCDKQGGEE